MIDFSRLLFFVVVRIFVLFFLGLNIRRLDLLPKKGPAIIVANHNSHLDTMVLISLFPLKMLPYIHPVAAADYFLTNKFLSWFSTRIIGIIPIIRGEGDKTKFDPLTPCYDALEKNQILILFPEGTRGEPEQLSVFKKGISWLIEKYPHVPVTPVFIHGLGKSLPKNKFLPMPVFCDVFVESPLLFKGSKEEFMSDVQSSFETMMAEGGNFPKWE